MYLKTSSETCSQYFHEVLLHRSCEVWDKCKDKSKTWIVCVLQRIPHVHIWQRYTSLIHLCSLKYNLMTSVQNNITYCHRFHVVAFQITTHYKCFYRTKMMFVVWISGFSEQVLILLDLLSLNTINVQPSFEKANKE